MKLKIKKYMAFLIAAVFLFTSVSSVASARIGILSNKPDHEDTGEIFSEDISERSVLLIKAEKGVTFFGKHFDTYLPINLPKEFRESGLKVEFSFSVSFFDIFSLSGLSQFIRGILPIKISDIGLIEPEPETNLNFNISLDSTGPARSCIPIKATLKNNGDAKVSVSEMALEVRTLNFNIRTPKGEILEYIGPTERRSPEVVELNPGEKISVEIEDVTKEGMFGLPDEESHDFTPGVYTIQGFYTSGDHIPTSEIEEIFEGTLETTSHQFEVLDESNETKILVLKADPVRITQQVFTIKPEPIEYLPILGFEIHAVYEKGTEVEITALEKHDDYIFESWLKNASGNENTVNVTMNEDKEVIGKYDENESNEEVVYHDLTVVAQGCGSTSPSQGVHSYEEDEKVDIEAKIPKMDGCVFIQWQGDDIDGSTNLKETLTMDSDKRVIAIFECVPVADFTFNPLKPKVDEEITFVSTSSQTCSEIVVYRWNFGDGNSEVLEKPEISHAYSEEGSYLVKLTVQDKSGKFDSIEKEITIESTGQDPSPNEGGTIQGTVKSQDELNKPIFNAIVEIRPDQAGSVEDIYRTRTDETGCYRMNVPAGEYTVTASKKGYVEEDKTTGVEQGKVSVVDFSLATI